MAPKSERFEMRLDEKLISRLDSWREQQLSSPSRAEAARQLIEVGLSHKDGNSVDFNDGQLLIISLLFDLLKSDPSKRELDVDFIAAAIMGGHFWALRWELSGLFHGDADQPDEVTDVLNYLDMWSSIEEGYQNLSDEGKDVLEKDFGVDGRNAIFYGFDGNTETSHMLIARFMIDRMGRFPQFKCREINSHMPTLGRYNHMYSVFDSIRPNLVGRRLNVSELALILQAEYDSPT